MNRARELLLRRVAAAGGWISRAELSGATDFSETRVSDELAELVVDGLITFNARGAEYRLAGTRAGRAAMVRHLGDEQQRTQVVGMPDRAAGVMRLGIARRLPAAGSAEAQAVACELEVPYATGSGTPDEVHAAVAQVVAAVHGAFERLETEERTAA